MRPIAFFAVMALALSTPSCVGGSIHGLDEAAWFELLATDGPLPVRGGDAVDYGAIQRLGPGALLFVAMRASGDGDGELALDLLAEAVRRETGRYRTRAVTLYGNALLAAGDGPGLVALCRSGEGAEMEPYRRSRLEAEGLLLSGSYAQAVAAIGSLRTANPVEAGRDAAELAAMAMEAGYKAGRGRWADEFSAVVAMDGQAKVYEALGRIVGLVAASGPEEAAMAIRAVGPRAFQLAEARALSGSRDYGPAVVAFRRYAAGAESPEAIAARIASPAAAGSAAGAAMDASGAGQAAGQSAADQAGQAEPTPTVPDMVPAPAAHDQDQAAPADAGVAPAAPDAASIPLSPKAAAGLFLTLPRAAASDAAKAFIAASRDEGAEGFRVIVQTSLDRGADPSRAYFDAFWHARFLRSAERWRDAETWFSAATARAANASERDAAAWYAVEAAWKQDPAAAIAPLGKALAASRNPGYFSDLIEPLSREALTARNGRGLAALDAAVSMRTTARDEARLSYLCARAAAAGIIRDRDVSAAFGDVFRSADDYAASRLRKAYDQKADAWYRMAAAYRLGLPLVDPLAAPETAPSAPAPASEAAQPSPAATGSAPTSASAGSAPAASAMEATSASTVPGYAGSSAVAAATAGAGAAGGGKKAEPAPVTADDYALALARFGLGSKLRSELGTEFSSLAKDTVRSVAGTLSAAGRADQAYRLIATLFWKSGFVPTRRDAELYWPRPYRDQFAAAVQATGLDEFLLYGLARSESAFDPRAVSKSGAVGLTQLMPATAAETAKRLRMEDYDLNDPEDNLAIGSAYFARVLNNVDGRVLPAVFSYNGGPTRFRRWEAEYGALPLDLLLEALSYSETRQYGRNVATAALSYAALYGEGDLRAYFAWLINESPRP